MGGFTWTPSWFWSFIVDCVKWVVYPLLHWGVAFFRLPDWFPDFVWPDWIPIIGGTTAEAIGISLEMFVVGCLGVACVINFVRNFFKFPLPFLPSFFETLDRYER